MVIHRWIVHIVQGALSHKHKAESSDAVSQSGVSEVKAPEDFEAALDLASSMVSSGSDYRRNALSSAF